MTAAALVRNAGKRCGEVYNSASLWMGSSGGKGSIGNEAGKFGEICRIIRHSSRLNHQIIYFLDSPILNPPFH